MGLFYQLFQFFLLFSGGVKIGLQVLEGVFGKLGIDWSLIKRGNEFFLYC